MKRLFFAALTLVVACATAPSALPQSVPVSAVFGRDTVHFTVALYKAPAVQLPPVVLHDTLWCTAGVCASVKPETIPRPKPPVDTVLTPPVPPVPPVPPAETIPKARLVTGPQGTFDTRSKPLAAGTVVDARGATWTGKTTYPINWAGGKKGGWVGGTVTGTWDQATTPWTGQYHSYTAMYARPDSATVSGFRVHNYGDGVRFTIPNTRYFTLRGSWFSDLHDDCVEDDMLKSGLIEDNLFDGCYQMISMRAAKADQDTVSGVGDTLVIRNNLGRVKGFAINYKGTKGSGGFFKTGSVYPDRNVTLILEGNVFRADSLNGVGSFCLNQHNKVARAKNNVMVWTGTKTDTVTKVVKPIPYPCLPLPPGWTLTRDPKVWDAAVAAWKARH